MIRLSLQLRQMLALAAFMKFARVEEQAPVAHRRYAAFAERFCALSYPRNDSNKSSTNLAATGPTPATTPSEVQVAAVDALRALVHKTMLDHGRHNVRAGGVGFFV